MNRSDLPEVAHIVRVSSHDEGGESVLVMVATPDEDVARSTATQIAQDRGLHDPFILLCARVELVPGGQYGMACWASTE